MPVNHSDLNAEILKSKLPAPDRTQQTWFGVQGSTSAQKLPEVWLSFRVTWGKASSAKTVKTVKKNPLKNNEKKETRPDDVNKVLTNTKKIKTLFHLKRASANFYWTTPQRCRPV